MYYSTYATHATVRSITYLYILLNLYIYNIHIYYSTYATHATVSEVNQRVFQVNQCVYEVNKAD